MSFIQTTKARSLDAELHWLVNLMITPEFPALIEALQICLNLLLYNSPNHPDKSQHTEKGPSITLPVSSGKLDDLKGTLVRDGAYITKMNVALKERHFTRAIHKLHLAKPFLLPQINTAKQSIDNAIELIVQAMSVFDEHPLPRKCDSHSHSVLISVFDGLLRELQAAKNNLQLPTQPELVFPIHRTKSGYFDPELPAHIALDLYISQAEVCIDLKDLTRVEEKPWCEIDKVSGKSYVDMIRDQMSTGSMNDHLREPGGKNGKNDKHDRGLLGNVMSHFLLKHKYEPQDYVTRGATYDNSVVMVNKKIEVSSADPVLVSAFTKLDSVEYMVSSFLDNIRTLYQDD